MSDVLMRGTEPPTPSLDVSQTHAVKLTFSFDFNSGFLLGSWLLLGLDNVFDIGLVFGHGGCDRSLGFDGGILVVLCTHGDIAIGLSFLVDRMRFLFLDDGLCRGSHGIFFGAFHWLVVVIAAFLLHG